jgi:hypothetical protein
MKLKSDAHFPSGYKGFQRCFSVTFTFAKYLYPEPKSKFLRIFLPESTSIFDYKIKNSSLFDLQYHQ